MASKPSPVGPCGTLLASSAEASPASVASTLHELLQKRARNSGHSDAKVAGPVLVATRRCMPLRFLLHLLFFSLRDALKTMQVNSQSQ